ncbi:MAG: glycoside hydrolase family 43 protein, partial [Acidobacteriota bacterium]|nr:glycoside hydrolase family 43 protein [Acidobacteriota bacterium]
MTTSMDLRVHFTMLSVTRRSQLSQYRRVPMPGLALATVVFASVFFAGAQRPVTYKNPVLSGDFPDPSVIRVGKDFWATATSSEWGPQFPLLHSRDLVNWRIAGVVFSKRPAWAVGNFWAPEISEDRGRYFVYYVGRKQNGPLCVAVAVAALPSGPYKDRGPLICQEVGSIDPFPARDEQGRRYLIWKEDGNSVGKPTPLWAQPLSEDGTKLEGQKTEILRNTEPWEAQLVEGPAILRRNGWFYLFYSGNACCGRECNYALGVARSRKLLGPWEKNPLNPILAGSEQWKCPGHGTIVSDARGHDYLLYHAYQSKDFVYVGRQGLLDEV